MQKTTLTVKVEKDLDDQLEAFQERQAFKPSKSQVIRKALREYLDAHSEDGEDANEA